MKDNRISAIDAAKRLQHASQLGRVSIINYTPNKRVYIKPPKAGINEFNRRNFLSIVKAKNCLFSRRNGIKGVLIFGYSICLRIGGKDTL